MPAGESPAMDHRHAVDVPGRKALQIQAFGARLRFAEAPTHWLDWCAGKGHLGRYLARDGAALTCLEWDETLVRTGAHMSERLGIPARHRCQDVLAADAGDQLQATHTPSHCTPAVICMYACCA